MTDYTELKLRAEHAVGFTDMSIAPDVILALIAENDRLKADLDLLMSNALPREFIKLRTDYEQLKAENEALRSKLSTVHFVCDRLPDQDGCRFIELENQQGESVGDEFGKWEIRPDGLAQLVVEISGCCPSKGEQP